MKALKNWLHRTMGFFNHTFSLDSLDRYHHVKCANDDESLYGYRVQCLCCGLYSLPSFSIGPEPKHALLPDLLKKNPGWSQIGNSS